MDEDGLSNCRGAKRLPDGTEEKDFEEKELDIQKECAEACPVNVIHIIDKKTGEKLI
jgi:ferredoxin